MKKYSIGYTNSVRIASVLSISILTDPNHHSVYQKLIIFEMSILFENAELNVVLVEDYLCLSQ